MKARGAWIGRVLLLMFLGEALGGCVCRPVRVAISVVRGTERGVRDVIKVPETGARLLGAGAVVSVAHRLPPAGYGLLAAPEVERLARSVAKPRILSGKLYRRKAFRKPLLAQRQALENLTEK